MLLKKNMLSISLLCKGSFTQWTVAFPQRDMNFSISALTQSTAENADRLSECKSALTENAIMSYLNLFSVQPDRLSPEPEPD